MNALWRGSPCSIQAPLIPYMTLSSVPLLLTLLSPIEPIGNLNSSHLRAPLDTATVRKRMGVVALAVPSQLGAASPSAGDSRRYNGGSTQMRPTPTAVPACE